MLRLRAVTGIRVHDELNIGETLSQQKSIDRHDDDVLISVDDQRRSWI
jgi:hypothetical protein